MNAVDRLLDNALSALQAVAGETVVYEGVTVPAVVSSLALKDEYGRGGHLVKRGAHIAIRSADLSPAVPAVGDLITAGGLDYQIEQIDSTASGYTLTCAEVVV
jgi:hypothetical protein